MLYIDTIHYNSNFLIHYNRLTFFVLRASVDFIAVIFPCLLYSSVFSNKKVFFYGFTADRDALQLIIETEEGQLIRSDTDGLCRLLK